MKELNEIVPKKLHFPLIKEKSCLTRAAGGCQITSSEVVFDTFDSN